MTNFPDEIWKPPAKSPLSYWLLLINTLANREDRELAAGMAIWNQFSAKYQSDVIFFQRSEQPLFSYIDDYFQPEQLPVLFLSNSPHFVTYITFSRDALRQAYRAKALDDLFNDFQQLLQRQLSIHDIKTRLVTKKALRFLSYAWDDARDAVTSITSKVVEASLR